MTSEATTAAEVHGHPALQHHFENMEQQREAGTLGMWVFLVTEIMFFGGMFLAYTLYRSYHPAAFASGSNHLDITLGAVNTGVLILSRFQENTASPPKNGWKRPVLTKKTWMPPRKPAPKSE